MPEPLRDPQISSQNVETWVRVEHISKYPNTPGLLIHSLTTAERIVDDSNSTQHNHIKKKTKDHVIKSWYSLFPQPLLTASCPPLNCSACMFLLRKSDTITQITLLISLTQSQTTRASSVSKKTGKLLCFARSPPPPWRP